MAKEIRKEINWRVDLSRGRVYPLGTYLNIDGKWLEVSTSLRYLDDKDNPSFDLHLSTEWKDPEVEEYWNRPGNNIQCSGFFFVCRGLKRKIMDHRWRSVKLPLWMHSNFKAPRPAAKKVYFVTFQFLFAINRTAAATQDCGPFAMVAPPTSNIRIASPFLNDRTFSDVVVVCRDETFHCHKVILAGASSVFMAMLTGNFREAHENRIDISCFNRDTVASLIKFIYEDDVPEEVVSWELFEAAKMYDMRSLEKACLFRLRMSLNVSNCCRMLEAASKHNLPGVFRLASRFAREHKEEVLKSADWKRLLKINKQLAKRLKRLKPLPKDSPKLSTCGKVYRSITGVPRDEDYIYSAVSP